MPKVLKIVVGSVAGGLLAGAGMRLIIGSGAADAGVAGKGGIDGLNDRVAAALSAVQEMQARVNAGDSELRGWVDDRIAAAEVRLQESAFGSQQQILEKFVESVQSRVVQRIAQLETEVSAQSRAMAELRECSLQTERSMQRLLEGIDKLTAATAVSEVAGAPEVKRRGLFGL